MKNTLKQEHHNFLGVCMRVIFKLLLVYSSIISVCSAGESYYEKEAQALKLISQYANDICGNVPLTGKKSSSEFDGKAEIGLSKLVKSLTTLGINAGGSYSSEEFNGLIQSELAPALKREQDCRERVSSSLQKRFLPDEKIPSKKLNATSKKSVSQIAPSVLVTPKITASEYADKWIRLLDNEQWNEAYSQFYPDARNSVSPDQAAQLLADVRRLNGRLIHRKLAGASPAPLTISNPNNLKGYVVAYMTEWENAHDGVGTPGDEIVGLVLSTQGEWNVLSYTCLNCKTP